MDNLVSRTIFLESQIIWGILFFLFFWLFKNSRRIILFGALVNLPLAFLSTDLFREVWKPERMMPGSVGIEDFIFCFFIGGLSLGLVSWMLNHSVVKDQKFFSLGRLMLTAVLGIGLMTLFNLVGIKNYENTYLSMALTSAVLISFQRVLWKVFLVGSLFLVCVYSVGIHIGFLIWPEMIQLWDLDNLSGILIGKAPLEELTWALIYGGTWPVLILFITQQSDFELSWNKFLEIKRKFINPS